MKIAVAGCLGRVGRTLCDYLTTTPHQLVGGTVRPGQEAQAQAMFSSLGITAPNLHADVSIILEHAEAIIDFTQPEHTLEVVKSAANMNKIHIIGTTGLNVAQQEIIAECASKARIVQAPNMSIGVNVLLGMTERVARALGEAFDAEIYEIHHRHKQDAPSGTALALGRAVAQGRSTSLDMVADYNRHGFTGERQSGKIGFAVARGGDVVGDHTVTFAGTGERLELTHRASSRLIYAQGAVYAAQWAAMQPAGLYDMQDVLGLR